jgi:hypothetical protein
MNNAENGLKYAQGWQDMHISAVICHIWCNCFGWNRGKNEEKRGFFGKNSDF